MPRDQEDLLLLLLREGSRSQAVQLYREETGAGTDDAREVVSRLAKQHGLGGHRLPLLPLVLLVLVVIVGVVALMAR